jgi:hypothetical protein
MLDNPAVEGRGVSDLERENAQHLLAARLAIGLDHLNIGQTGRRHPLSRRVRCGRRAQSVPR